ncbi:hypothetical protein Bpfe_022829, partial [Biomphalaria pfeifferi]
MPSGQDHSCPQSDCPAYKALSLEKSQGLLVQFGRKDSLLTPMCPLHKLNLMMTRAS